MHSHASAAQRATKKRAVLSCIPCYTKKQKGSSACNRQYPCNHCTKRRCPEQCSYSTQLRSILTEDDGEEDKSQTAANDCLTQNNDGSINTRGQSEPRETRESRLLSRSNETSLPYYKKLSITEVFGYFEDSQSNMMAVLNKLGATDECCSLSDERGRLLPRELEHFVKLKLQHMPDRSALDLLIQFFAAEVDWIDQLVHVPTFLTTYSIWWTTKELLNTVEDLEFAVLILRICSYASLFLPSPSYTLDRVRGITLAEIRDACTRIGDEFASYCYRCAPRGSLVRVQHLLFTSLQARCEGKMMASWEALNQSACVAQRVGICIGNDRGPANNIDEFEIEMRRRTFCNLFIWDRYVHQAVLERTSFLLSRQLDRIPFLPNKVESSNLPRMCLGLVSDDANQPNSFSERLLQMQLARFWRSTHPRGNADQYDVNAGQAKYDDFCTEYIATLPPAFELASSNKWEGASPVVLRQRLRLHLGIYDAICWHFRPALLLNLELLAALPPWKQALISSQRRTVAVAALKVLEAVASLHALLGGSYTRFADIAFFSFEGSVLLVLFCTQSNFDHQSSSSDVIPGLQSADLPSTAITKDSCRSAVRGALERLQMLADVSTMAAMGAQILAELLNDTADEIWKDDENAGSPHAPLDVPAADVHGTKLALPFDLNGDLPYDVWAGVMQNDSSLDNAGSGWT